MCNESVPHYDFATPMMQQYLQLKAQHADCLLLFRLGDFYELFLDDARVAARVLGIVLTARARGKDGKIPMAGVPYHAVGSYIAKLIKAGYKVAICDQVSEPTGKGLVDRQVTRIITPGTALDDLSLNAKSNNYLLGLAELKQKLSVVVVEVSTGELRAEQLSFDTKTDRQQLLQTLLSHYQPTEVVLAPKSEHLETVLLKLQPDLFITHPETWPSDHQGITDQLKQQFKVKSLKTVGLEANSALTQTLAGVLSYVQYTQRSSLAHLHHVLSLELGHYLQLDPSTISNLELLPKSTDRSTDTSLLSLIDTTKTAMGSRLLKRWLLQPLQNVDAIQARHHSVAWLVEWSNRLLVHQLCASSADIERLLAKAAAGTGTPRQLVELAQSLQIAHQVATHFAPPHLPELLKTTLTPLQNSTCGTLAKTIATTITTDAPIDPKQGGYILAGVDSELDTLADTIRTNRAWMANLERELRQETGISSLKVRFNKVFGFYIEVSNTNLDKVPDTFIRKQTLVNGERFITPEMKRREEIILTAEEQQQRHCYRIFQELITKVVAAAEPLQHLAHSLATLDCLLSFAHNAIQFRLVTPTMTTTAELDIKDGRHPIVEQLLESGSFVPNDTLLNTNNNQVMLITGPNMAGKSVYMRQVALIVLLAHIGSFVPATKATIGIVDRIFVRSGAGDQIAQGLSTFMVEMVETAFILRYLTEKSLIIMDEIGRGTSTYDGISIAQAIAAYLVDEHNPHPKTLFATHYHELQSLSETYPDRIHNYHLAVTGDQHQPVFLYTLKEGGASSSFGIAVARLAGLPPAVTNQAALFLAALEQHHHHTVAQPSLQQKEHSTSDYSSSVPTTVIETLTQLSLDQTTPLEALNILAGLKQQLRH
jgi:DNA mismatch repair protein MutS